MITREGFVLEKDGKYCVYDEVKTYTGTYSKVVWVDDVHQATLFQSKPPILRGVTSIVMRPVVENRSMVLLAG